MSLSAATFSASLQAIAGVDEASTINGWTQMMATYFAGAVAGSGPGVAFTTNPVAIATARAAMSVAMGGMTASGAAPGKIQAGVVAWWTALAASPASYFAGASSISAPAGLSGIAAAFPAIFTANKLETSKAPACDRIANMIHAANAGGTANISGSKPIT